MTETVVINERVLDRLIKVHRHGRLAHAYLFRGQGQMGKMATALAFAKYLNCEEVLNGNKSQFCDVCPSCVKIHNTSHPDVHVLYPDEGNVLKIEMIRDFLEHLKLRSFYGGTKVFIMAHAQQMTAEAANAVLKSLEEPSSNSLLILSTEVPEKIFETILSRCHAVHFFPESKEDVKQYLSQTFAVSSADAQFFANYSEGSKAWATDLSQEKMIERKNEFIDAFVLANPDDKYIKKITSDKEVTREFLRVLWTWVRDGLLYKAGVQEKRLVHSDRLNDLKRFQQRFSSEELVALNGEIVDMYRLLSENLNIRVPLLIIRERMAHG